MSKREKLPVYAVIMAGGGGTRFWPWSREKTPKQLLPIVSSRTMIEETVSRLHPFLPPHRIFVVTSRSQIGKMRRALPSLPPSNFLVEPVGKNTAPCLGLAAFRLKQLHAEAIMVVLPADHFIADQRKFLKTLEVATLFAQKEDFLITLGLQPTAPETGYGYIQKGELLARVKGIEIFKARAFREKPNRELALSYLAEGNYLWNSGMFVWRVEIFLKALETCLPELYQEMAILPEILGTAKERRILPKIYASCPAISVDYGVMEKAPNVAMIQACFPWDDVGSWSALWKIHPKDQEENVYLFGKENGQGKILALDSSGCLIRAEKNLIALLGMRDTIVVEAGGSILICPKDKSQEVRQILAQIKEKGWKKYL
ncbi:MAG: mannose-1-phosphate guanylyltransferase [Thermodesulfobacteriota bacterium]